MAINNLASVVAIAGTDPSGGAGIQADIKAISATGAYAASVITALLAQNTQGVQQIQEVSTDFVQAQMRSVFDDLTINAVKIGMLHHQAMIEAVFDELKQVPVKNIVFDPVMVAKDGSVLLELSTIDFLKVKMTGAVFLITPNLWEAEHLLGASIVSLEEMRAAAESLGNQFQCNVLLKGGHGSGGDSSDVLYLQTSRECLWFHAKRIATSNTHGTGCSLSSAIASYLAQGNPLQKAVQQAKNYITEAIQSGAHYRIGKGNGPVDHFYFLPNRNAEKVVV